ncbi:MAG: hypothetical protein H6604_03055 [Flavobacteriales bacterium]|nr:hypothetical protein [Flavobacteriales bacterium]
MSNFRRGQEMMHPNKRNMIMSTLIVVLLCNLLIQIWLLYTALNNALEGNTHIAVVTFIVSLVLFVAGVVWLYFLPKNVK